MAGKFELKKSKNGKFFFNLLASNGQVILSSEMYEAKANAVNGIESVKKNAAEAGRFDKLTGKDGSPYFTLKAGNGQVVARARCIRAKPRAMPASPRSWPTRPARR